MAILKRVSVERSGNGKGERWDLSVEEFARIGSHLILALHGPDGRFDHRRTGITESMPWLDVGCFTNNTLTVHFLYSAIRIGDHPVTRQKACCLLALISYGDGVREDVPLFLRIGLRFEVLGFNVDVDAVRFGS